MVSLQGLRGGRGQANYMCKPWFLSLSLFVCGASVNRMPGGGAPAAGSKMRQHHRCHVCQIHPSSTGCLNDRGQVDDAA